MLFFLEMHFMIEILSYDEIRQTLRDLDWQCYIVHTSWLTFSLDVVLPWNAFSWNLIPRGSKATWCIHLDLFMAPFGRIHNARYESFVSIAHEFLMSGILGAPISGTIGFEILVYGLWTNALRLALFLRVPRLVIEGKIVSEVKISNWTLMMKHRGRMNHKSPSLELLSVRYKQV